MVGGMLTNWAMIELGEARCRPLVTFLLNQEEEQKMLIAAQIKTAPPITHQSHPPYPPCNLQIRVSSELHLFSHFPQDGHLHSSDPDHTSLPHTEVHLNTAEGDDNEKKVKANQPEQS